MQNEYTSHEVNGIEFVLTPKYQPIKLIGKGTYGAVISANVPSTGEQVAIKKLTHCEDIFDAKRILREIIIMKHMQHENILGLSDVIYVPTAGNTLGDIYLVCELMETDLNRVVRSNQKLQIEHIQYFVYQVLRAFKYLHSAKIIHRDCKPSNILLNENCDLKICDFGLSRTLSIQKGEDLTEYVVTRYYRAPEIMLSSHQYTEKVDSWSVGCSFAEVLNGRTLFPGEDYINQVMLILNNRGSMDAETKAQITNQYALQFVEDQGFKQPQDLKTLFPGVSDEALDLLDRLIALNPMKRISIEDALRHPFLSSLHDEEDEPTFEGSIDFGFETDPTLDMMKIKKLLLNEIGLYNPKYYELANNI